MSISDRVARRDTSMYPEPAAHTPGQSEDSEDSMKCTLPLRSLLLLVGLFGMADAVVAQPVPIDLGTLGGSSSTPAAINESGHVVGSSQGHAFLWTPTTGMMDLATSTPPQSSSAASAINNLGHVGGVALFADPSQPGLSVHPFLWTPEGGMVNIDPPHSSLGFGSTVRAMNDVDQVVGTLDGFLRTARAFIWTSTGGMRPLGSLGGPSFAVDVNSSGLVVGIGYLVPRLSEFEPRHAFAWTESTGMLDLGTLGGRDSQAADVNDDGQVVGWSYAVGSTVSCPPDPCIHHAFLWTATGGMVSLGTLGGLNSAATAVNAHSSVVGSSSLPGDDAGSHAFLWTAADGMVDLGAVSALDINDHSQVVGSVGLATDPAVSRGFVWTLAEGMVLLPPLPGYASSEAWFVNNSGHVIGISCRTVDLDRGGGSTSLCQFDNTRATMWVVPVTDDDVAPPTLFLPETIVVDGTSPAGATVTYVVSASDDVDPNPMVICSRLSGSVFPLLVTTVSCTATDAAGNSVRGMFDVVVKDAPQQLADTITLITGYNLLRLGTSLPDKLQIASDFAAAGQVSAACDTLAAFLNQVRAQTGKGLTVDQATELTMRGIRIQHVIGC